MNLPSAWASLNHGTDSPLFAYRQIGESVADAYVGYQGSCYE
ncbi:MAG: hypothetical protein ACYSXD_12170 [Planctomycetota bacterium]